MAAQPTLSLLYDTGEGVAENKTEAIRLLYLAAEQGEPGAQLYLGLALSKGVGSTKDPEQALLWVRRAADLGVSGALTILSLWYKDGENGLAINYTESMRLYRLAHDAGEAIATTSIGLLFENGLGVAKDIDEA